MPDAEVTQDRFRLSGDTVTDQKIIQTVTSNNTLTIVELKHSKVTARAIQTLKNLPNLRELRLMWGTWSETGRDAVATISSLSQLRSLTLCPFSPEMSVQAKNVCLTNLVELEIDGGTLAECDCEWIAKMCRLTRLSLGSDCNGQPVSTECVKRLSSLTNIVEITGVFDPHEVPEGGFCRLETAHIIGSLSYDGAMRLVRIKTLRKLTVSGVGSRVNSETRAAILEKRPDIALEEK